MRTPGDIKNGLEHCAGAEKCIGCTYATDEDYELNCLDNIMLDALAYIQQLESRLAGACGVCAYNFTGDKSCLAHIKQLESRLAQVERERNSAVQTVHGLCLHCKNDRSEKCRKCLFWPSRVYFVSTETYVDHWEWRGVCPESTKEEA